MRARKVCGMLLVASSVALGSCAVERDTWATVELHLASDPRCRPAAGAVDWIEVRALGDFAASADAVALLPVGSPAVALDSFPPTTQLFAFETAGAFRAGAVVPLAGAPTPGLLLPFGRPCTIDDPRLRRVEGAAFVSTPDGELMIVGGELDEDVLRRIVRFRAGSEEVDTLEMRLRRHGATATWTSQGIVIAGGSQERNGGVHDTFERVVPGAAAVELAGVSLKRPRRDHGALRLPDDRVILVGGRSEPDGEPLREAERIDLASARVDELGRAMHARLRPALLRLDDGTVIATAGIDGGGAVVRAIEVFDAAASRFVAPEGDDELPDGQGTVVALPGARFAFVAVDGEGTFRLSIFARVSTASGETIRLARTDVSFARPVPIVSSVRVAVLDDGSLLVTGSDARSTPRAFILDPGTGFFRETGAALSDALLVPLSDGSVLALTDEGAAVQRELVRTPYDNPPATVGAGFAEGLSISAPGHWLPVPGGFLSASREARIDLPMLRFSDFSLILDLAADTGEAIDAELLLVRDDRAPIAIRVTDDVVGFGSCEVPRAAGAPTVIVRRGDELSIEAGRGARTCRRSELTSRVGLAVRARPGTIVRALREITRL